MTANNEYVKKILVCVNESEQSYTAVKIACAHAQKINAIIEMVSVVDSSNMQKFLSLEEALKNEMAEKAQVIMDKALDITKTWPDIKIICKILEGPVAETITNLVANDSNIIMTVLGETHNNESKTLRAILDKMDIGLAIPMMIVPGNLTDQQITALYNDS